MPYVGNQTLIGEIEDVRRAMSQALHALRNEGEGERAEKLLRQAHERLGAVLKEAVPPPSKPKRRRGSV